MDGQSQSEKPAPQWPGPALPIVDRLLVHSDFCKWRDASAQTKAIAALALAEFESVLADFRMGGADRD